MQPNQQQPSKRQLPFTSSKPPLGDYHRLSTDPLHPSSQEPEGIVVKSTPLKRKSGTANYEHGVGAQVAGSGSFNGSSPTQTPISGKAGNSQKAPRTSKARICLGSPSGNNVTPVGPCRYEVPDPNEAVDYPQRRSNIVIRSTMVPTDVYLISKFEEKFAEINIVEEQSTMPSTSGFIENETASLPVDDGGGVGVGIEEQENQRECPDAGTSQNPVSGIMKIVPDFDNQEDYLFLSDADVSNTDLWTEYVSAPHAQSPPSSTTELTSANTTKVE